MLMSVSCKISRDMNSSSMSISLQRLKKQTPHFFDFRNPTFIFKDPTLNRIRQFGLRIYIHLRMSNVRSLSLCMDIRLKRFNFPSVVYRIGFRGDTIELYNHFHCYYVVSFAKKVKPRNQSSWGHDYQLESNKLKDNARGVQIPCFTAQSINSHSLEWTIEWYYSHKITST